MSLGVTFLNIPPGLSVLMGLYQVSYTGISVLLSALLWSHALMQLPAGMIADWLGIKRTLLVAMLFMTIGNLLPAISPMLSVAFAGRIVTGFGTALAFVGTMKMVALHVPKGRQVRISHSSRHCFPSATSLPTTSYPNSLSGAGDGSS